MSSSQDASTSPRARVRDVHDRARRSLVVAASPQPPHNPAREWSSPARAPARGGDDHGIARELFRRRNASTTSRARREGDMIDFERSAQRTADRRARSMAHREALDRARAATATVLRRVRELERAAARLQRASGRNAGERDGGASASGARREGKNASRLRVDDDGEFPALGVGARRNLTSALEGTSEAEGRPRRIVPTAAEPSASARRIAPTMVSAPSIADGDSSAAAFGMQSVMTPLARSRSRVSATSSPPSAVKPPSLERLSIAEPSVTEQPVALSPALEELASAHASALLAGYPLDQSSELARLCQLLCAPAELSVEPDEGVDERAFVRNGREAHAYACAVMTLIPSLACALGESALEALVESKVLASHAPALHARMVREYRAMRVASGECERAYQLDGRVGGKLYGFDLLDALAKANESGRSSRAPTRPGRVIALAEQQAIEHNRERTRDAFYAFLRASASRTVGMGQDATIASRARALVANTHPTNIRWLADLFVTRLSQSSAVGEVDEELGKSITPARLSRLHERIVGSSAASQTQTQGERLGNAPRTDGARGSGRGGRGGRGGGRGGERSAGSTTQANAFSGVETGNNTWPSFVCLFPPAQQPFVRFIETTDSHKFCVALQRSLIEALHALDPNSSPMDESTPTLAISSSAGQTERMLAAHAIGSFLGLLTFGVAAGANSVGPSSTSTPLQGIDLVRTLRRASRRGELVVSAPWVLAFLRFLMWDAESVEAPHYIEALTELRAIASSRGLDPQEMDTEFNASRMCLRAILAGGLSVTAPITTSQATNWNSENVLALPPPPLAAVDVLPTTDREIMEGREDPLEIKIWGADWVPSASANASATANTQEAPNSPNQQDGRIETNIAPDLSRIGVDRRYVESVCPMIEQAIKTMKQRALIAQALAEEVERASNGETTTTLMETPSAPVAPVNAPRRVLAQPQRLEPTSLGKPARLQSFGMVGSLEDKSTVSPTFGVASPRAESALTSMPSMELKSSATEVKHALQRAFLQNAPGLRRLVDFAVDAATLAAVDDATASITARAVSSAQPAVRAAAKQAATKYADTAKKNCTTFVSHAGSVIEEAWTPEFERAVERSAMAATREVISSVERTASEDAGARAAAAVAALAGASTSTSTSSNRSTAATKAACGVAADAAAFAAAARVRSNLPFELHARIATDARRLLKSALHDAKETIESPTRGTVVVNKAASREAEYVSIAASAIASALSSASKWPAGTLMAECAALKSLAERKVDALALSRGITNVVESIKRLLEQDSKFSRAQVSRKKPSAHTDKQVPDSRPGEKLAASLSRFARSFIKILLAAPQNALWKSTKAASAEEGWGMSRDEVCEGVISTLVLTFAAAAPALSLVEALAPPDATDPWKDVYDEMFSSELWLPALREFPATPFAQSRVELVFADALAKLPRRAALRLSFLRLIDDAGKRVGRIGHALILRSAIRFCALVAETSTHDEPAESRVLSEFARGLADRCRAVGEPRLARRAECAEHALTRGVVHANIKSVAEL